MSERYRVVHDNQVVHLERIGGSIVNEAFIVAIEREADGLRLWCDRRIHSLGMQIDGWSASGAVVTCLTRTAEDQQRPGGGDA